MKKLVVTVVLVCGFLLGYGAVSMAYPPGGMYSRGQHYGYFNNVYDHVGARVWPGIYAGDAMPAYIDTAQEFIDFVKSKLAAGKFSQDGVGASFLIQTMINNSSTPNSTRDWPPTAAQIADWEARVRYAESQGRITWRTNYSYTINSFYQGAPSGPNPWDDAFYDDNGTAPSIVFRNGAGAVVFAIKWLCANPVGNVSGLPSVWRATGRSEVAVNPNPRPGEQVTFNHYIKNEGPGYSDAYIWSTTLDHPSGTTLTPWHNTSGYLAFEEKLVDPHVRTVPLTANPGDQICERVYFEPAQSGSPAGDGGLPVCATVAGDFVLAPTIEVQVNGVTSSDNVAEAGDAVSFIYKVNNSDDGASNNTACSIYGLTRNGFYPIPSPHDTTSDAGFVPPATGCPQNFPANTLTTLGAPENLPAASVTANKSICRTLLVNPASPAGGSATEEKCVYVRSKPYVRVYGGDLVAGSGVATAPGVCTTSSGAAIIGWNKRGAPNSYDGAGVQYAAYALSSIFDVATALGNGGGAAPPTGLSFANTATDATNGQFGGNLGSGLPCIRDHFATKPAGAVAMPAAIGVGLASGSYSGIGDLQLGGGTISPGADISMYVDGDLFIGSNITYGGSGSWTSATIPMFRLIVRGNIFVDNDVTQLDGLYVAQPNGAAKGITYTCALAAAPFVPMALDGTLASQCSTKLTVNGGFVARQVYLLRTLGTLKDSAASEDAADPSIAEVFNYNPALWISQPVDEQRTAEYDAINGLPPVL